MRILFNVVAAIVILAALFAFVGVGQEPPGGESDRTAMPKAVSVWVQPLDYRVRRGDPAQETRAYQLHAAGNEWESAHICVRSHKSGTATITGGVWPAGITSRIYREHQLRLTEQSHGAGDRNRWFRPDWYGDALIPGSTLRFGADETHAFLIDIYVPKGTAPGDYESTYEVLGKEVTLKLTVWNFALPHRPHLKTNFGKTSYVRDHWPRTIPKYNPDINSDMAKMMAEHRINPLASNMHKWSKADLAKYDQKYFVNNIQIGGGGEQSRDAMQRGVSLAKSLGVPAYVYASDEPDEWNGWDRTNQRIARMRSYDLDVGMLVTDGPSDKLKGVTIWCDNFRNFDARATAAALRNGDEVWQYTALSSWQNDIPLSHFKLWAWICKRHRITGFLYWRFTRWNDDPFKNPLTYTNSAGRKFFGEGVLVYPKDGTVIPSVRLKVIRDAIDDFDYLTMAGASPDTGSDVFLSEVGDDKVSDKLRQLRKQIGEQLSK